MKIFKPLLKILLLTLTLVLLVSSVMSIGSEQAGICPIENTPCTEQEAIRCTITAPCDVSEGSEYYFVADHYLRTDGNWYINNDRVAVKTDQVVSDSEKWSKWKFKSLNKEANGIIIGFQAGGFNPQIYLNINDVIPVNHVCSVIETRNCGDIKSDGDIQLFSDEINRRGYTTEIKSDLLVLDLISLTPIAGATGHLKIVDTDAFNPGISITNLFANFSNTNLTVLGDVYQEDELLLRTGNITSNNKNIVFSTPVSIGGFFVSPSGTLIFNDSIIVHHDIEVYGISNLGNVILIKNQDVSGVNQPINVSDDVILQGDLQLSEPGKPLGSITLGGVQKFYWPNSDAIGSDNFIYNPGFEDEVLSNWILSNSAAGTATITSANSYRGSQSVYLDLTNSNELMYLGSDPIVKPSTSHLFSAQVYITNINGGQIGTSVDCYDSSRNLLTTTDVSVRTTNTQNDWVTISNIFETSSNAAYCRPNIWFTGTSATFYLDSTQLEEGREFSRFSPATLDMVGNAGFNAFDVRGNLKIAGSAIAIALDIQKPGTLSKGLYTTTGNITANGFFAGPLNLGTEPEANVNKVRGETDGSFNLIFGSP